MKLEATRPGVTDGLGGSHGIARIVSWMFSSVGPYNVSTAVKFISQQQELLERKTRFSVEQTVEVSNCLLHRIEGISPFACKTGFNATRREKLMYSNGFILKKHALEVRQVPRTTRIHPVYTTEQDDPSHVGSI